MGKNILTPRQSDFLELASKDPWLTKNFFLSGGTALSEFYLRHRLSEDLDFFSEKEVSERNLRAFVQRLSSKLGVKKFTIGGIGGVQTYLLEFSKNQILKVDFSYYPFPPIERWTFFGKLRVASIYDIAVDKLQTIGAKARVRDYIDLYFILKEKNYQLGKILQDIRVKFDWILEPSTLASQFLRVKDLKDEGFPRTLKPFNRKKMEEFFLSLAKRLEKEIFVE